ncbi:MAG: hypothetical protein JWP14_3195 [Frankiales bacterium]|jgi:hypothetical protein|nr:hypothetical protein [Frankiales bacterium]
MSEVRVTAQLLLPQSCLSVALCTSLDDRFLSVVSLLDARQQLLVPLQPSDRKPAGIALSTRTGRWTSLTWALAWGCDALPETARIRFSSDTLRFRTSAEAPLKWLDGSCWVAEAAGDYALATLVVQDVDVATVVLSDRIVRGR